MQHLLCYRGTIGKRGHGKYRSGAPGDGVSPQSSAVMVRYTAHNTINPLTDTSSYFCPSFKIVKYSVGYFKFARIDLSARLITSLRSELYSQFSDFMHV